MTSHDQSQFKVGVPPTSLGKGEKPEVRKKRTFDIAFLTGQPETPERESNNNGKRRSPSSHSNSNSSSLDTDVDIDGSLSEGEGEDLSRAHQRKNHNQSPLNGGSRILLSHYNNNTKDREKVRDSKEKEVKGHNQQGQGHGHFGDLKIKENLIQYSSQSHFSHHPSHDFPSPHPELFLPPQLASTFALFPFPGMKIPFPSLHHTPSLQVHGPSSFSPGGRKEEKGMNGEFSGKGSSSHLYSSFGPGGPPTSYPSLIIPPQFSPPSAQGNQPSPPGQGGPSTILPPSLTALTLPAQNVCAKCNIGFRMTSDLVYHMRSHHKRDSMDPLKKQREEKLKCTVCHESFRERHHLTRHMTAHQDRGDEVDKLVV